MITTDDGTNELKIDTPRFQNAASKLFGESDETRRIKLNELKYLVLKMPDNEVVSVSDGFLIRYLRGKAFDVSVAAKAIEKFIQFSLKHPEWVKDLTADEFVDLKRVVSVLKARDEDGRLISLISVKKLVKVFTPQYIAAHPFGMIRFNIYYSMSLSHDVEAQIFGHLLMPRFTGFTLRDARTFTTIAPFYERLAFNQFLFNCAPLRTKGYVFLEEPMYVRWFWNMAYPFLPTSVRSSVHLCGRNYAFLATIVDDPRQLPKCLGGQVETDGVDNDESGDTAAVERGGISPSVFNSNESEDDEENRETKEKEDVNTVNRSVFRSASSGVKSTKKVRNSSVVQ